MNLDEGSLSPENDWRLSYFSDSPMIDLNHVSWGIVSTKLQNKLPFLFVPKGFTKGFKQGKNPLVQVLL